MKLISSDIKKFQSLYVKYFNRALSSDEARAELTLLVRQVELAYQPVTAAQFESYLKDVNEDEKNETQIAKT